MTSKENQLGLGKKIEELFLSFYSGMPSTGNYPFTFIKTNLLQILVLKRTDYNESDLLDYMSNTKEFSTMPSDNRETFLENYRRKSRDPLAFQEWCERTTNIGIGILMHHAKVQGINLKQVDIGLVDLDNRFDFQTKNLLSYQLFDIHLVNTASK